jgi:3-deoxy-D-manno-octulosonate 8-phosphate phosphatase (KDO 8-P phosphatase)
VEDISKHRQWGDFYPNKEAFLKKIKNIKALVFDWDGVFNSGRKTDEKGSDFSEVDSMGINLLRFGFWLKNGHIPYTAIITGMNNQIAQYFAKREHFQNIFFGFKNKLDALNHISENEGIKPSEIAFVFDDILDFGMAKECGLRLMMKRDCNPLLNEYAIQNNIIDYHSANSGGNHGLRESCELILDSLGLYKEALENRMVFSQKYQDYSKERMAIENVGFRWERGEVISS